MKSTSINPTTESAVVHTVVQEYGSLGEEIINPIFRFSIGNSVVVILLPCYLLPPPPSFHSIVEALWNFTPG